ncbi:hypothetical protein SAMN05444921_129117 [Streptomyces wuyuanensis]|uniref:Enolase C-terminal domain-containing protein n=1 Tax=Streptomyces wuyuanensis TaxID=1196353 RepID=A0A1H0CC27_9ACTN|nr:hypothetical protein SAMN05444921_129117 [Streptomyces wuyuanensis]
MAWRGPPTRPPPSRTSPAEAADPHQRQQGGLAAAERADDGGGLARGDVERSTVRMERGVAHVPDAPGLGVEVDERVVRRLAVDVLERRA